MKFNNLVKPFAIVTVTFLSFAQPLVAFGYTYAGSYDPYTGSYDPYVGSYDSYSSSYNSHAGSYNSYAGNYNTYVGSYDPYAGSYNSYAGTYDSYAGYYDSYAGIYDTYSYYPTYTYRNDTSYAPYDSSWYNSAYGDLSYLSYSYNTPPQTYVYRNDWSYAPYDSSWYYRAYGDLYNGSFNRNYYNSYASSYPRSYPEKKKSEPLKATLTGPTYSHKDYDVNYNGPVTISNGKSLKGNTTVAVAQLDIAAPYFAANFNFGHGYQYPQYPIVNAYTSPVIHTTPSYAYPSVALAPVAQQYVSLTQIPYTGFDFGLIGNTLFWIALMTVAAIGAYAIIRYQGGLLFFTPKSLKKEETTASFSLPVLAPSFATDETALPPAEYRATRDQMRLVQDGGIPRIIISRA